MAVSSNTDPEKLAIPLYVIGVLSFSPLIGVLFGFVEPQVSPTPGSDIGLIVDLKPVS